MTVNTAIKVRGGVLVAHDGSAGADAALKTAMRCAPAFGGHVEVVRAWDITSAPRPARYAVGYVPPLEDYEEATRIRLERDVRAVRTAFPDVVLDCSVVHGGAAEKLIEASPHVDMIVVGSRGHGGFLGLLLGSVSHQVLQHSRCRVLVDRGSHELIDEDSDEERLGEALASELKLVDPPS